MTAFKKVPLSGHSLDGLIDSQFGSNIKLIDLGSTRVSADEAQESIGICCGLSPEDVLEAAVVGKAQHVIQEDSIELRKEINVAALMLNEPQKFFSNPLKAILDPTDELKQQELSNIYYKEFSRLEEKYQILEEVGHAISSVSRSNSFKSDVQAVVDELTTNAIFHSTDDLDQRKNYLENKTAKLFLAKDESRLVICCRDPNGTLNINALLKRIQSCYTSEVAQKLNMGRGGGGIGSFLVHNMSISYFVAVRSNVESIICSVLPLNMSNRKRSELSKNLHYINIKGEKK